MKTQNIKICGMSLKYYLKDLQPILGHEYYKQLNANKFDNG